MSKETGKAQMRYPELTTNYEMERGILRYDYHGMTYVTLPSLQKTIALLNRDEQAAKNQRMKQGGE